MRLARDALTSLPDDADALAELARTLESSGGPETWPEALETIERALAIAVHPSYLVRKARLELRVGDPASARRSLALAARLRPDDGRMLLDRARLAALSGGAAEAAAAAERLAVDRDGSHAVALARVFAHLADGEWKKALRGARATARIAPLDCCTRATVGIALAGLGRRGDARLAFDAANERSPAGCLTAHAFAETAVRTKPAGALVRRR